MEQPAVADAIGVVGLEFATAALARVIHSVTRPKDVLLGAADPRQQTTRSATGALQLHKADIAGTEPSVNTCDSRAERGRWSNELEALAAHRATANAATNPRRQEEIRRPASA